MKTKIYYAGILVLAIFLFSACRKEVQPVKPIPSTYFSAVLQNNQTTFPNTQTATSINIKAGTNGWYVTQASGTAWIVPTKNFGAGDYSLGLTIKANTTGASRTGQITLTSTNKNLPPVVLSIIQSQ